MHIKVVDTIFDYTQTLRSSEDIITGIFATALDLCETYRKKILKRMGINFQFENDFCINTGYSINDYLWCDGVRIKPDLMISNLEEGWGWEIKDAPNNEELVLIESKLSAPLNKTQEDGYRDFRDEFKKGKNNKIINILISVERIESGAFNENFTWNEIFKFSEEIYNDLENKSDEKGLLRELIDLMKVRLSPYVDDLRKDAELCPKKILTEIKRRLKSKSFKQIHETDTISGLYDKEELKELREKYNLTGKSTFSYFLFKAKKREYSICCAIIDYTKCIIWIEDEVGDDAKIVSEPHQINFADESWENRWFGAIFKINEDIQILKK